MGGPQNCMVDLLTLYIAFLCVPIYFPVLCPILLPPDNTNTQVILSSTRVGSEARYECFLGYMLNAPERRMCQADGTWSGVEPSCIRK